jgi:hypothetical protein
MVAASFIATPIGENSADRCFDERSRQEDHGRSSLPSDVRDYKDAKVVIMSVFFTVDRH